MQINNRASKVLGVADGDRVGIESVPNMAALGFLPYTNQEGEVAFPIIFKSTKESGTSKLAVTGNNFDFSASKSWQRLGGNSDGSQDFRLSEGIFGVAQLADDTLIAITVDTDPKLATKMVAYFDSDLGSFAPGNENVSTIAEVQQRGECCFYLNYEGFTEKAAKLEKKSADEANAPVGDQHVAAPVVDDGAVRDDDGEDF